MHACLLVDEILRLLTRELVVSKAKATIVSLACCSKIFEDPALDALWETQDRLLPLLKSLPGDVWEVEWGSFVSPLTTSTFPALNRLIRKSFKRIPTEEEWAHVKKYARRIRDLTVDASKDRVTSGVLLALQHHTTNEPLLPGLKTFECMEADEDFIPFIPLFFSPGIVDIGVNFVLGLPVSAVASIISRFLTSCPDLESITLNSLPRDSIITDAVSEMLLGCNQDTLKEFQVDSPLTEEARGVLYQLPKLSSLWAVVQGPTSLPPVALPNLTSIDVEHDDHLDWLRGFRGMALEKLERVYLRSESEQIGDILGAFEKAVSTSVTLSVFKFYTSRSWYPNYRALLRFTQLKKLEIEFHCDVFCTSTVDDDTIVSLARTMPKLEVLRLGGEPCGTPTGVTIKGLVALACGCLHLSKLRIHFEMRDLEQVATTTRNPSPYGNRSAVRQGDCGLKYLDVGKIPIPGGSTQRVAVILLKIFPRLLNIKYSEMWWWDVVTSMKYLEKTDTFVEGMPGGRLWTRSAFLGDPLIMQVRNTPSLHLEVTLVTPPQRPHWSDSVPDLTCLAQLFDIQHLSSGAGVSTCTGKPAGGDVDVVDDNDDIPELEGSTDKQDIDLVMQHTDCSRARAVQALKENHGDLIGASACQPSAFS